MFSILAIATNANSMSASTAASNRGVISNTIKVQAGRGNATAIIDHFFPQTAEIKVGQSITWYNPTQVAEHIQLLLL